ncbi:MAG TPA: DUF305 domain-containing protein [Flavisolibacter sp.]
MKKIFVLFSFAFSIIACNDSADHAAPMNDTSQHSAETTNEMHAPGSMGSMHKVMEDMMRNMKTLQPTGDPDHDFALLMKHHHQGALEMAKEEMQGGTDEKMKQMARKMAEDQQKDVAELERYLENSKPSGNSDYGRKAMSMMTEQGSMKMESGSLDAMFASMMIPHHEDGIEMSEAYLKEGKNQDLKKLAQNIINVQKKERDEMKKWLDESKAAGR